VKPRTSVHFGLAAAAGAQQHDAVSKKSAAMAIHAAALRARSPGDFMCAFSPGDLMFACIFSS
jgi:hypothetical protein